MFRVDLTQGVSYDTFKSDLESVGIETVFSGLKKRWIVQGTGDYGTQLAAKAKERADEAKELTSKDKATFVDAIKEIAIITPEEKIDGGLSLNPIGDEMDDVDVETWPMTEAKLKIFGNALYQMARDGGGDVINMFYESDYCAIRVRCDDTLLREIAVMPEVARISRSMQLRASVRINSDIMDYGEVDAPDPDAPGILLIDSGVVKHPLLEPAIAKFVPVDDGGTAGATMYDDDGHGTCVAGVAAYGDVQACVDSKVFQPKVRLYSAKVMKRGPDGGTVFDGMIDEKIRRAVDEIAKHHPSCRIVNLSLGDSGQAVAPGMPQPRLALLIDRLSNAHKDILFVVSAGNIEDDADCPYPRYLLEHHPATHLIDPATSAHAITAGSLFRRHMSFGREDHPSPTTRIGPGLEGMIKPDVVEYGGGYAGPDGEDILTFNMAWAQDGRLFTFDAGTSMSAPKVAHALALLRKAMPDASRNLLKALLISSAEIPSRRPSSLAALSLRKPKEASDLLYIYGYGKPDLDDAMYSRQNRAVFVYDGSMRLNHVDLFAVRVPKIFSTTGGRNAIEVTLAFDPPTDGKRHPYHGVAMKYYLYKDTDLGTLRKCYEDVDKALDQNAPTSDLIKKNKVELIPGTRQRGAGIHQKAWTASRDGTNIDPSHPLILVVVAEKKWIKKDYTQDYSVVVAFRHSSGVDIYSALRSANRARAKGGAPQ